MGPVDIATHLLNFAAPALFLALLVPTCARLVGWGAAGRSSWWSHVAIDFVAGLVALGVGLVLFGRDGKMLTYAGMVVAVASAQWLAGRGWRG